MNYFDDRTETLLRGLCGALEDSRATLLMFAPHLPPETPALLATDFWMNEARTVLASAIEAGTAAAENTDAVHESAVAKPGARKDIA